MNHKHKYQRHTVQITNASTGETKMSAPVAVYSPRHASIPTSSAVSNRGNSDIDMGGRDTTAGDGQETQSEQGNEKSPSGAHKDKKTTGTVKPKVDIETLAQFIEYAYSRKGKALTLKAKLEKKVAQSLLLDTTAEARLLALAAEDELLAVPRQILLFSREMDGFPALRASLHAFVSSVMLKHPIFDDTGVRSVLRNLPDAQPPATALAKVVAFTPPEQTEKEPLKGAEIQVLRRNAANLFVTWLASNRSMNTDEVVALLLQVVWQPAASELEGDNARLRALTEVDEPAGVGLACIRLRQQAIDARSAHDQALREVSELRSRLAETDKLRVQAEEQLDSLKSELEKVRETSSTEMTELRRQHEVERTHLRHDHEQLRGRMVHRLNDGVEMLEVGLTALRNKTPRVEVMLERAEHVVETLLSEIKNLREE